MPRILLRTLAFSLIALSLACGSDGGTTEPGGPDPEVPIEPNSERGITYYVIRHTERDPGIDAPINEEGEARAERLADALEFAGIDEIITTVFIRGQQSGEPLSERTGAPITVAPPLFSTWPELATEVAEWRLDREVEGDTYLMIGHSSGYNTTLLQALGAPDVGTLAEDYQDFVVLIREPDGSTKLSVLQYGGPSSLD